MDLDSKHLLFLASAILSSDSDSSEESDDTEFEHEIFRDQTKIARIENYVENTISKYTEKVFQSHFRISRPLVYGLIDGLERSGLIPTHTDGKEKISSEKSFLLTLWYMSNTETFRQVSDRFDVSLSSSHRCLLRVLNFILSLRLEFITWPTTQQYKELSVKFRNKQGIEDIVGAIDGCHIRIRKPKEHDEVYVNRKSYHSILMQGVVDNNKCFLYVYCGEPGSIHDARLLRKSNIYNKAQENPAFFGKYFLLGDSAYPSLNWLVPPFKDNGALSANQKIFNYKHSSSRIIVEHTFGLLKGRFRRLRQLDNLNINTMVKSVMACCVLHNICQIKRDNTHIEPYNVTDQLNNQPKAWAEYITFNNRREELFEKMFPVDN